MAHLYIHTRTHTQKFLHKLIQLYIVYTHTFGEQWVKFQKYTNTDLCQGLLNITIK